MKNLLEAKISETIHAPASRVWEALTNPELIKKYFFGTNTRTDWKEGSPIRFSGEYQGKSYEDKGTILKMKPGKMISYSYWSSMSAMEDKPENYYQITYELSEQNGQTILTVTQDNIPDEKTRAHSAENWKMVLGNLKNLVEA